MDLTIVALYTLCDNLLIAVQGRANARAKMSDAAIGTVSNPDCISDRFYEGQILGWKPAPQLF